jgi:hypothetical protein
MDDKLDLKLKAYMMGCVLLALLVPGRLFLLGSPLPVIFDLLAGSLVTLAYTALALQLESLICEIVDDRCYQLRYLDEKRCALVRWFCVGMAGAMLPTFIGIATWMV